MKYTTYDLILKFPCGTEKIYKKITHIKGAKINGKRPIIALVSNVEEGAMVEVFKIRLVMNPYCYKIFIDENLVAENDENCRNLS